LIFKTEFYSPPGAFQNLSEPSACLQRMTETKTYINV